MKNACEILASLGTAKQIAQMISDVPESMRPPDVGSLEVNIASWRSRNNIPQKWHDALLHIANELSVEVKLEDLRDHNKAPQVPRDERARAKKDLSGLQHRSKPLQTNETLIRGLFNEIPAREDGWDAESQAAWLRTAISIFSLIYGTKETITVSVDKQADEG